MTFMGRARKYFGIVAVTLALYSCFLSTPVGAQSDDVNIAQGIQISPALVELNGARNNTYTVTLNVTNITSSSLVYTTSTNDFNSTTETGSPHIIMTNDLPSSSSITSWVSAVPDFTLQSRKSKTIIIKISIPGNAEPGGHYGIIRFSGLTPNVNETGVGLSASAGVLLLIRVDGTITEKATLTEFFSSQNAKQSSFFENSPITFVTRIKNEGNIHLKPSGDITIHDTFGNLVSTLPINTDKANVLPQSIRRFESKFSSPWLIGHYTADLVLGYGTTGQTVTGTISFWVIPYKIILVGLFVIVTAVFVLSRLIKVYNKHIIEKSKHEKTNKKSKKHTKN